MAGRPGSLVDATERVSKVIDRDTVRCGDTTIEYEVRRSRRRTKTIEVKVSREGVRVYAPWAAPDRELRRFVRDKASWILNQVEKFDGIEDLGFVDGETLPYLGRETPMFFEIADVRSPEVAYEGGRFRVTEPSGLDPRYRPDHIGRALLQWYHARAMETLPQLVDDWWPLLGRGPKSRVLIGNQKSRWGSCGTDGTLRFNWRVMMLERKLIDYIVVHEIAHLSVRNHSSHFWNLVGTMIPDAKERRRRLREIALGFRL